MYKLTFTVKQPEMEKTLELEKLEDIFQPSEKYENVERFSLADVFDNVDYGINILKPTKDEKDFVIIYATETFWDYFSPNLHEYLIGRLFNQTLSQFVNNFDSFNNFSSVQYKKNRMDGILKLYENNKLIKVWSQINISQGELLYCCMQDQTDYYLTKEKEKNIFEHSAFPILDINRKCQIITSNKSFKDLFDFSKEELNEIGLDNIVTTFNTEDSNVSSFADAINQIFDEKLKYNDSEIGIITKENEYKWVKAHIRLISNELVRISFQDLSELKRSKNHALNLNKYLSGIEEASKTAFYIKDDEGYHWTDEIFNILEIDSNRVYLTDENFLYEYMNPQDINKIKEAVKNCTLDNPVNMDFEVITAKGNKEFLRIFFRLRKDNKQLCQLGFIQNITEQRIAQKEAIELKENIEGIQEVSKIFISSFGDGEYNFTDEIYNILNINRTDYAPNQILDFIDSKDQEKLFYHFNNVSPENPDFHLTYKITSPANGETKYITCYNKANFSENGDLIKIIGFQQDVTEEAIIKIEALHLRDNFALIQGLSKMFIAEYDGENYYFTSEAYNILELNPNEYSDNINIVEESVIPEDEHIWKRFNTLNPEDSHYQLTFRVKTGKGNIRYLYVQNMATFDENGKFQKIIGFLQDVTEERLITNEALNLQESLDSVGDFAKIALASYENGEYTWTDEFYNILKINPKDYDKTKNILEDFIDPKYFNEYLESLKKLSTNNNGFAQLAKAHDNEGNLKYLNTKLVADFDTNDNLQSMHLFIQDLTEDTINQKESSKLRENFSVIQETSKIVLCSYENGKYEYTSEIYNILAINPNDYPNYKDLVNLFIFPEDKHLLDNVMNLTTDNPDVQGTYRVKNNNEIKYIQAHNKAIFNENGELIRIIGLLQDITEETLAKQESAKLNENFNVIESTSKIFIADFDGEKYSYTNEAYNILGINPKNYSNNFNLFTEFVLPEDLQKCEEAMFLTPEKPESQFTFRIKTDNDEIKYLICQNKALFDSKGELIRIIGFVQDITEETLVEQEALRLQDNFNVIQETSKVVLCLFENGEYSYTPEIYNILGIKSDDYPNNVELVGEYIITEDVESYESIFNLTPEHTDEHNTLRIKNANSEIKYIQTHNKAIFTNQGELIRIIGFIQDVTEEKLAQNEASRLTNNFNLIQNSSKIFIGEYENSKFSFTKEAYNILEINSDDFTDEDDILTLHILPEDKNKMIKCTDFNSGEYNFHNEFRVKTGKGNIKYLKSQVMVKNDDNGDLLHQVGFIQDITEETVAKKSALDLQRSLEIIQSASKIVIAHVKDGKYTWTSEIYDILEINPEDYPNDIDLIGLFTVPEDQGKIFNAHNHLTPENPNGHNLSTIITPNGNMKVLEGFLKAEFGDNGEILEIICFIHEITDKVNREKELEQLSEDRKILLQEVHHRVKNNLQLILSFLNIESRYNRDNPEYVIEQTKNRINTMALTHEEVYQSPSVSKINLENFLTEGVSNIFNTYTSCKIKLNFDIEPIEIEVDKGIPIGLLVNEVALNTIKYAFPENNEGNFYINLKKINEDVILKIWDDGVGLPSTVDVFQADSLGFIIIRNLTQQIEAELTLLEDVSGFGLQVTFEQ